MDTPVPQARARGSGVVIPARPGLAGRAAARLLYTLIRTLDGTLRYRLDDPSGGLRVAHAGRGIFAIWHNRLALSLRIYQRFVLRPRESRRMAAIVSASRDGGILARVLELFEVQPVRGSSSRRGPQAVLEMVSWAERGLDLAITPDGPRGPRYRAQPGAIDVAAVSGLPIVPVSFDVSRCLIIKSWDRFVVPLPFARCVVRFGPALTVPRELDDARRETLRCELQDRLAAITDQPLNPTSPAREQG